MSQQDESHRPSAKWPQFVGPVLILLIAAGAAVFGVLWSADQSPDSAVQDTSTTESPSPQQQPDSDPYLSQVREEFPSADPEQQEALAVARAETDTYIMSEHLLSELLTAPEHEYQYAEAAADFAMEHVDVDWNEHAHQFLLFAIEQFPDAQPDELEEFLQHAPDGPQYTAEQTAYALSQLNQ